MDNDVELMRDLLAVMLEDYQTSPRSVVIVSVGGRGRRAWSDRDADAIEACLVTLLELDYIDGPGQDEPGFFLFRKLTRKGLKIFVEAARRPRDWQKP